MRGSIWSEYALKEGSWGGGEFGTLPYKCSECSIFDQTGYQTGSSGFDYERKLPKINPSKSISDFENELNQLIPSPSEIASWGTCSPCPTATPIRYIRLYGNLYKERYTLPNGTVNLNPGGGNAVVSGMYYACLSNGEYRYILDQFGNPTRYQYRDTSYIDLPISPCFYPDYLYPNPITYPKYFNVRKSSNGDNCEIYYGYHVRGDCNVNVKIPLCGTLNGSGCGSWCLSLPNNPCEGGASGCQLQIEFPFNTHSFDDILSVLDILPDPERPEQGYFKMLVKFKDETILEVKAYNSCLSKYNCKSCEGEELVFEGDLKQTGNINLITDHNSYTFNSNSTSTPLIDQGQYRLINKIPVLSGSTEPAEISDHSPSANTNFFICKSHQPISQDWSKQTQNPALDNLPYLWGKKYLVQSNTNYEISFYYLNANKTAASTDNSILVRINQKDILEKKVTFDANYQWKKISFSWNSGAEEYLDLGIFNIETNANNYIAFDDISIQRICGCSGGPLSQNFDFDQGNNSIGADANIMYSQPGGSLGSLGSYYVNANLGWIGSTTPNADHTYNGKGKFAWYRLVDNSLGAPFSYKIWNQKIDILRNKDYELSLWWKMPSEQNIQYGNHKAVINVKINNIIVQSIETGNNGDTWNIIKANWNSGENVSADIKIEVLIDRSIFTYAFEIALDDVWFKENCNGDLCETKAPNLPVLQRNLEAECVSYMNLIRDHNAKIAYESYINKIKKDFREAYIAKCLSVQETFLMKSENNEYHTTLYYYDQAGNLVRTVPPEGVDLLSESEISAVKQEVVTGDAETYNSHSYTTTYQYNSLNQLISQSTPDQEDFNVWDGVNANLFPLTTNQSINSLSYVDKYRGVIVGNYIGSSNGFIKYGDPIKNSWTDNLAPIDYGDLLYLHVVSETEVYATNKEGAIIYTTDGGTNWYSKNAPVEEPIIYLRKLTSIMIVLDGSGRYWKSLDNGTTWGGVNLITSVPITIKSISSTGNTFVALGSDGARYYCSDITLSNPIWVKHTGIKSEKLNKVGKYRGLNKWFALGTNGFMLSSNDEGNNWNWLPNNLNQSIKDAFIWNDSKGVFFTDNNKVFYTAPNSSDFTNLIEYNSGINFVDMAISGDVIYLLDAQGKVYINNIYSSSNWSNTNTLGAPAGGGDFQRITISNDYALFRTRVLSGNLEIFRSIGSGYTWSTSKVQLGSTIYTKTLVDLIAFTETLIEVIVIDGSTKSLFEIKDINTINNTSTQTAISLGTGEPKKYEKNQLAIPFLVTNNSGTLKLHERSSSNTWQAFDYPLPINNTNQSSVWMENSNLNAKGICVGVNGDIFTTIYKWKPSTTNVTTTFDRSNRIKLPQLNAINTNGINVVAVGEKGAIIYSAITSGNLSPNWYILQHNCDKNDLLDIKGNKDANMIAVGVNSKPIRIKNVSSIVSAASITSLPYNLDGKSIKKLEVHNYTSGNSNMNLFLVDDFNGIHSISFNLSSNSYVSSTYTNTNSTPITNSLNGIGSYGTKLYLIGNKSVSSGQTHQILKIDYASGALSGSGYGVSLNNVTSLNKVVAIKGTNSLVAVGKSGFLIKSEDKGLTWKSKYTGVSEDLISVSFSDANNGIAVGKNKTLIFTTNGGNKWQTQTMSGSNYDFVDVAMGAADRIIAIIKYQNPSPDVSGILVNVTGLSSSSVWNNVNVAGTVPFTQKYNAISFPGPKFAFIVGDNNKMLRLSYFSSNYTATVLKNSSSQDWSYAIKSSNSNLYSIYFRDYENGFVGGDNGFLMRTRNGGGSSPSFEWSISYCGKKIALLNGCLNENLHLVQFGSTSSDTVVCLKNAEYSSHFYYDGLGRMVASQNTKQMREGKTIYSYTLYDYKGRIIEVGKKYADKSIEEAIATYNLISGPVYAQGMVDYNRFAAWIVDGGTTFSRKEVTKTFYDNSYYNVQVNNSTFIQDNLRGRVVSTTYSDLISGLDMDSDPSNDSYLSASHYSYDIHGNVKSLVQENKILNGINPELISKVLEYDYDLISGKVNKVIYQKGMSDQFIHKYGYDADNRIIAVETSHDGVIWQKDAKYLYYRHGPLARIELGTQQVQGVDYAYTIQGWLKGVNSTNLKGENDIGKDAYNASTNHNANFGKDEFGFSLNYFEGDYTATKLPNGLENYFLGGTTGSGLRSSSNNLYNGNIKSMVTTIGQFTNNNYPVANGMVYGYDQLNRITSAQNNTNYDRDNNTWLSGGTSTAYKSDFTYDANGNIMTLQRRDESGTLYDDFTYNYDKISNGNIKNTNRLTHVIDAISSSSYSGDIENGQTSSNYKYDALGNLIGDAQEEIGNIEWTVYGKIKKITRSNGSSKPDLEFIYDPSGNRICKIVKPASGSSNDWVYTVYYRDAQGNIMSTYESKFTYSKQVNTYIYGSSRLGELVPDAFANCGVNLELNEINDKANLKTWFSNYTSNVLGFSPGFSNAMGTYIDNELESDLGVPISEFITSSNPQGENYVRFVKNLSSLFCRIRLFHGLSDETFNNQIKNKIKEWFIYSANASGNWSSFSESIWLDIENKRKLIGDETYAMLLGSGSFVYDDGTSFYALGSRKYELSNHLGNVLAVITDKKIPNGNNGNFEDLKILSSQFLLGIEDWDALGSTVLTNTNDKLHVSGTGSTIGAKVSANLVNNTNYTLALDLNYAGSASDIEIKVLDKTNTVLYSNTLSNNTGVNTLSIPIVSISDEPRIEISNTANNNSFDIDNISLSVDGVLGVSYYSAQVISAQDYYPFGTTLPGRTYQNPKFLDYRFHFNGKEADNEINGTGNDYDFGARIYDARLGRWLSLDPKLLESPFVSPYKALGNNPIIFSDPDGKKEYVTTIITDESTGEQTKMIRVVVSNKVITDYKKVSNTSWNPFNNDEWEIRYYDFETVVQVLRKADGTLVQVGNPSAPKIVKDPNSDEKDDVRKTATGDWFSTRNKPMFEIEEGTIEGEGGYQGSGFMFYNLEGGASATKWKTKADADVTAIDIEDAMTAFGGLRGSSVPKIKGLLGTAEFISTLKDLKEAKDSYDKSKVTQCSSCGYFRIGKIERRKDDTSNLGIKPSEINKVSPGEFHKKQN
ncbi:MAG: hypothetical protein CFE21_14910 [Bacteroidetes bacterium B1(2017)]|nr:MAG: hypothetical protein CFE21_14910 [Bacteroidetes bacterium B1(2017)]